MFRFIPKEEKYFALLSQLASKVNEGGELFCKTFQDYGNRAAYAEKIKAVEVVCDDIAAQITQKLNTSFITPIDREDIYLLVKEVDDVIDMINALARRLDIYDVPAPRAGVPEIADVIGQATRELAKAFAILEKSFTFTEHIKRVNELEKQADALYYEGIRSLFRDEKDPIALIKWLAIYEELENCADRCKDVAESLEGVAVKNK